jgi:hypothetical protein
MQQLWEWIGWLVHHAGVIGLVLTWIGIAVVYLRRRSAWSQKQFQDQVTFSLNYVVSDTLAMRTLLEARTNAVWLNEYGLKRLMAAAQRTTAEQPFVQLPDRADQEFVNRAIKNALSERFAATFVAEALGVPVHTGKFVFGITYERYEDMRTLKFRVLLIEEQALLNLFNPGGQGESLKVPNPVFRARLQTLKALHALYVKGQETGNPIADRVQLGAVP